MKKTIKVGEMKRRINLINEVKCLYSGNYKTLIQKKIEYYDTNRWEVKLCSLIGRINIVKMNRLPKEIYRFNAISVKTQMAFFTELEQIIMKVIRKHKKTMNSKTIFIQKNKAKGTNHLDFKLYYKATVSK